MIHVEAKVDAGSARLDSGFSKYNTGMQLVAGGLLVVGGIGVWNKLGSPPGAQALSSAWRSPARCQCT